MKNIVKQFIKLTVTILTVGISKACGLDNDTSIAIGSVAGTIANGIIDKKQE